MQAAEFELPDAALSGEDLPVRIIAKQADEFLCSRCLLDMGFLVTQGIRALLSVAAKWASQGVEWVGVASITGIRDLVEKRACTLLATASRPVDAPILLRSRGPTLR